MLVRSMLQKEMMTRRRQMVLARSPPDQTRVQLPRHRPPAFCRSPSLIIKQEKPERRESKGLRAQKQARLLLPERATFPRAAEQHNLHEPKHPAWLINWGKRYRVVHPKHPAWLINWGGHYRVLKPHRNRMLLSLAAVRFQAALQKRQTPHCDIKLLKQILETRGSRRLMNLLVDH